MNIKNLIKLTDSQRLTDSGRGAASVLEAFGYLTDAKTLKSDASLIAACKDRGLEQFLLPDGYAHNRADAEWRRVLSSEERRVGNEC